jgi:hypothetical protein
MKSYTIKHYDSKKENKLNLHLDLSNNVWFNNNIFCVQYNDNNINIILDNRNNEDIFYFKLKDLLNIQNNIINIQTHNIEIIKYKDILSDNIFEPDTEFINLKILYKLINNIEFKKWLQNIKSILNNNKSYLFDIETQQKTTKKLKKKFNFLLN